MEFENWGLSVQGLCVWDIALHASAALSGSTLAVIYQLYEAMPSPSKQIVAKQTYSR